MKSVRYSYSLLADADSLSDVVLNKIFSWLPCGKRYMKTWEDRLEELDTVAFEIFERYYKNYTVVTIHDIACSNAMTSVNMFYRLSRYFPVVMQASDYYDAIYVVKLLGIDFIFDVEWQPLQMSIGKTGFSARRGVWRLMAFPLWEAASRRTNSAKRISLFHPKALRLAETNSSFTLVRADFFNLLPQKFDVVRLANVLFPTTDTSTVEVVLRAAVAAVADSGLLIIGAMGDYSFLRLRGGDQFSEIGKVGNGFAHKDTLNALDLSTLG